MNEGATLLRTCLLDLLQELPHRSGPWILGGGYGLYLWQVHLQEAQATGTLIPGQFWPRPRGTEDLDFLLRTEVVVDAEQMQAIRAALDRLGYVPIPGREYLQFDKAVGPERHVKVDLLTGPLGALGSDPRVRLDQRRVRPRRSVGLHAHRTDEAVAFQEGTRVIPIGGRTSAGQECQAEVHIPQPFTFILMKLFAFRDRCQDPDKELGRHHAIDLYRILMMLTEEDFRGVQARSARHRGQPAVEEARRIVRTSFASPESLGCLRLREHPLWNEEMPLGSFVSALADLLAVAPGTAP